MIQKDENSVTIVLVLVAIVISCILIVNTRTINRLDNHQKSSKECIKDSEQMNQILRAISEKSSFTLYPGYILKENGKLYWTESAPIRINNEWIKTNPVEVTNCVFDPFPYTSGDENTVVKINFQDGS